MLYNFKKLLSDDIEYYNRYYLNEHKEYFSPKRVKKEVEFLIKHLGKKPSSVCDIGCGQGRHLLEFTKVADITNGFGIDRSQVLTKKARKDLKGNQKIVCETADFNNWKPVKNTFDICYCLFSAFSYCLADSEARKLVAKMTLALNKGGLICIDIDNVFRLNKYLLNRHQDDENISFDPATMLLYSSEKHGSKTLRSVLRYYSALDLKNFIVSAGISSETIEVKGDFDNNVYSLSSNRIVVLGKKK